MPISTYPFFIFGNQWESVTPQPNYDGPEIVGSQVLAVINFPPKQIGKHLSEVLTLGVPDENGNVVLIRPDREAPVGGKLH